ncbi:MAG: imidazole glycerol phosphate synthase subunit HisF [Proteobacteria bacterium]|nr:MAG: imidazole glycerol phosphate synthase subunit HisF [Pseudomonadota bacterium]
MLKKRIIPVLLWKEFGLVKGKQFDSWRRVGSVLPSLRVYNTREVDELILVDITASSELKTPDFDSIRDFCHEISIPITVGGGIKSLEDVSKIIRGGADKVSLNTAAYQTPNLISEIAEVFGAQCVVVSIDVKKNSDGRYECYSHAGTNPTGHEVLSWAKKVESLGAGEILLTSIDVDGTMEGYDLELINLVASHVKIPVIAAGGAGNYEHLLQAFQVGNASAVAAASIFHFTEQTPLKAKSYLAAHGIPVRLKGLIST